MARRIERGPFRIRLHELVELAPRPRDEREACQRGAQGDPPPPFRCSREIQRVEAHDQRGHHDEPPWPEQEVRRIEPTLMQELHEQQRRDAGGDAAPEHERQTIAHRHGDRILAAHERERTPREHVRHEHRMQRERADVQREHDTTAIERPHHFTPAASR